MDTTPPVPAPPSGAPGPRGIPTYLWQSIVVTIVCCLPLGIPAIVYASRVNSLLLQGDTAGAEIASRNARMWCWIAAAGGLVGGLVYGAVALLGMLANH